MMRARGFATGRIVAVLVTIAAVSVLVSLGRWQLSRMHEKETLFAAFEAGSTQQVVDLSLLVPSGAPRWQRASTIGRYDSAHQFLLDNMTHQGQAGYQVVTPLVIDEGRTVLVNRGWVPAPALRADLPDVRVADDERAVVGMLNDLPAAGIALDAATDAQAWPRVLNYPTLPQLEKALQRPVFPRVLQLDANQPDGFVREWRPSTFPPERHLGYAITWFGLAGVVIVLFFVTQLRRAQ